MKDSGSTIEVVDMIGRKVNISREINRIYAVSANGSILIYTLAPEKLVGLSSAPLSGELRYINEQYYQLPVLGSNREGIVKANPDIIITAIMEDIDNNTIISNADRMQNELGKAVLVIDGRLVNTDQTYKFLGAILNKQARAKELADYCTQTYNGIKAMIEKIPPEKLVSVYYAEGPTGLATDPAGSRHTEVLDFVRGINVAQVQTGLDSVPAGVSLEQVMVWNPDLIIAGYNKGLGNASGFLSYARQNENWKNLKAVRNGQVYEIPSQPFNWFDRPPSISRFIGIKWLSNLLYPDFVKLDIKAETKEFYQKFFRYTLTDEEVEEILKNSVQNRRYE